MVTKRVFRHRACRRSSQGRWAEHRGYTLLHLDYWGFDRVPLAQADRSLSVIDGSG